MTAVVKKLKANWQVYIVDGSIFRCRKRRAEADTLITNKVDPYVVLAGNTTPLVGRGG